MDAATSFIHEFALKMQENEVMQITPSWNEKWNYLLSSNSSSRHPYVL